MPPMWATFPMQRLIFLAAAMGRPLSLLRAPQCAFGRGPHGLLFQKWTEFLVSPAVAQRLARFNELRCTCPLGAHSHARGRGAAAVHRRQCWRLLTLSCCAAALCMASPARASGR